MPPELGPLINIVAELLVLGVLVVVAAGILGYLSSKGDGAVVLGTTAAAVPMICLTAYVALAMFGYFLESSSDVAQQVFTARRWGAVGLFLAVLLITAMGPSYFKPFAGSDEGKRRASRFVPALWLGFCFASWIGHLAGGWVGLLTITLPAVVVFWLALYYLARHILPIDSNEQIPEALQCLVTFSLGTNYPYYTIEDRDKVERAAGNQATDFMSGPGIFLTGPDHVVAVASGMAFRGIRGPGVVFTRKAEFIQEPLDLRTQQRAYQVEAITKDGIPVRFNAAGPFQLDPGNKRVELGKPFPFNEKAVFKAFHARPVDIKRETLDNEIVEERTERGWEDLYEIVGTHVMQDIISEYRFDELAEPTDALKDPRVEIAKEYQDRMRQDLAKYGIKIPGGGVSNLLPADKDKVLEGRILSWQAKWQAKMSQEKGEVEAKVERLLAQMRAEVQTEMINSVSNAWAKVVTQDRDVVFKTIAMSFVDSLGQMVEHSSVKQKLPAGVIQTVQSAQDLHIIGGEAGEQDV